MENCKSIIERIFFTKLGLFLRPSVGIDCEVQ